MHVSRRPFGLLPDGTPIEQFAIAAERFEVRALSYGGIITALRVPDRDGRLANVVLGHDDLASYVDNAPYLGALVGRYANRIALGRVTLDGRQYQLATNEGRHHLHGGPRGFHARVWDASITEAEDRVGVTFSRTSAAGEEGYPGTLQIAVSYLLQANGDFVISYRATADALTIVNPTQHTYFNLLGAGSVLDHALMIEADRYTPTDDEQIPLGSIAAVDGTPFDFRAAVRIGDRIHGQDEQLRFGRGYDHNWVLRSRQEQPSRAAVLTEPRSGRRLEVLTTEPGLQFYSGNMLDGTHFPRYAGLCLETQHFPDSPNQPLFPSTYLMAGRAFHSTTVWRFGCL